jgi:hypothetical protein
MVDADQVRGGAGPGTLVKTLRRPLMRQGTVAACEDLGDRFRVITFEEPQLRGAEWVQIAMGAAFETRAYTPIKWDVVAGRAKLEAAREQKKRGRASAKAVLASPRRRR